ncbi:MAG: ribonuclease HII [Pseudomonadota bacterium]
MPDFVLEAELGAPGRVIAGIDEAGRGPLAGPVTAAAAVIPMPLPDGLDGLDDSKAISADRRATLLKAIKAHCHVGIGWASVEEIDDLNILQASMLAMRRALIALPLEADAVLVDGNRVPADLSCPGHAVIGGDSKSLSIAAASIVAKQVRDAEMMRLAVEFPGYGWETNMGYGTKAHRDALGTLGVTPHHRRSFAPVTRQLAMALT